MSSEINSDLLQQIRRHEGFSSKPYKCPAGKLTIGYGHNLEDIGITPNQAEYLLAEDLQNSVKELNLSFPWYKNLSVRRKQGMVNLHFNMGMPTLRQFKKFLTAMEGGHWDVARKELLDSRYAKQVKGRAVEIADQIWEG